MNREKKTKFANYFFGSSLKKNTNKQKTKTISSRVLRRNTIALCRLNSLQEVTNQCHHLNTQWSDSHPNLEAVLLIFFFDSL